MKFLKAAVASAAAVLVLSQSVTFERLSGKRRAQAVQAFDPAAFAARFWRNLQAETERAVDATALLELFKTDMASAAARHGRALGVSRSHSYLLRGEGTITGVTVEALRVRIGPPGLTEIDLLVGPLSGNDIRDASGLVRVGDFPGMMEFNALSSEINRIVGAEVLPPVLAGVATGRRIRFVGAATVHDAHPEFDPLRVTPIRLSLLGGAREP